MRAIYWRSLPSARLQAFIQHCQVVFHRDVTWDGIPSANGKTPTGTALVNHTTDVLPKVVGLKPRQFVNVNAAKHAQPTIVEVGINHNGNQLEVIVKDNGYGFDLAEYYRTRNSSGHHGLSIMKERAESLGGDLMITSAPDEGTEVKATIPLE